MGRVSESDAGIRGREAPVDLGAYGVTAFLVGVELVQRQDRPGDAWDRGGGCGRRTLRSSRARSPIPAWAKRQARCLRGWRTVSCEGGHRLQLDELVGQEEQSPEGAPLGRSAAGQGHQIRLDIAVDLVFWWPVWPPGVERGYQAHLNLGGNSFVGQILVGFQEHAGVDQASSCPFCPSRSACAVWLAPLRSG